MTRPRLSTSKVEEADVEYGKKGTGVLIALKLPSTPGVFYPANSQIFLWVSFIIITDLSTAFDMTHFLSFPNLWLQWLFSVLGLFLSHYLCLLSLFPLTTCIWVTKYGLHIELHWEHHLFTYFIYLSYFLAAPSGMWDLSSPTRDWTLHPLHWKCGVLTTEPLGKSNTIHLNHSPWEWHSLESCSAQLRELYTAAQLYTFALLLFMPLTLVPSLQVLPKISWVASTLHHWRTWWSSLHHP